MLMGDATPEYFNAYSARVESDDPWEQSTTPNIMFIIYFLASFFIMIIMLNIIIAIMGDTQGKRTALGRLVIYKGQLATVLDRYYRFGPDLNLDKWTTDDSGSCCGKRIDESNLVEIYQQKFPRYLTVAYTRQAESESEWATLENMQAKSLRQFD